MGAFGCVICYFTAAVTSLPILGLAVCALTGFCASMLWPGSLIVASERFPAGGVFIFAMMAAGGDLGASVGPQLVGVITDITMDIPALSSLSLELGITAEQLGLKLGLLCGMLFPLAAIPLYIRILKKRKVNDLKP